MKTTLLGSAIGPDRGRAFFEFIYISTWRGYRLNYVETVPSQVMTR